MGDEHRRPGEAAQEGGELLEHPAASALVEAGEGLVEEGQGGAQGEGAGEVGALRLAAGETGGGAVEQAVDAAGGRRLGEAGAALRRGEAAQAQGEVEVGAQGAAQEDRLLEGVGDGGAGVGGGLPPDEDATGAGPFEAGEKAEEGRLARAVRAEKGRNAALGEAQVGHVEHGAIAVRELHAVEARLHQRGLRCWTTVRTATMAKAMARRTRP